MRRKIASVVLALGVLPLFGAGGDTCTETGVTPNPKGQAQKVAGAGKYTLGINNKKVNILQGLTFNAINTVTQQLNSIDAGPAGGNWSGTLNVVAGNYDCFGYLLSDDANNGAQYSTKSNVINVDVK